MSVIRILPEAVANKIAAGEVVERPASVAKELVENSIDAGANSVEVRVESGGKRLIRVADDGCGMTRDDALLAFERHATSKITSADDLDAIATLGFRGEALPSIAAVSRLTIETRHASEDAGTRMEFAGGKLHDVREIARPCGTTIDVANLFYNVPARRKFLRSESTELGHIAGMVTHYALGHPDKAFRLESMSNEILKVSPVASHRERIYQVMGAKQLEQLVEFGPVERQFLPASAGLNMDEETEPNAEAEAPPIFRISGFVSRPEVHKLNRNQIYFFVSRRLIRDRLVLHALNEAYRNILPAGIFPVAMIFLDMPPGEVDVNVHPSKAEVRFRRSSFVHDLIRDTVLQALMSSRPVPAFPVPRRPDVDEQTGSPVRGRETHAGQQEQRNWTPPRGSSDWAQPEGSRESFGAASARSFQLSAPRPAPTTGYLPLVEAALDLYTPAEPESCPAGYAEVETTGPANRSGELPSDLLPLGQVRSSFIIATNPEGLWIIDQHVAHERVLFEQHLRNRQASTIEGQRLLIPIVADLQPEQRVVYESIAAEFTANGFEVEPFGQGSVAVKAAPADIAADDVESLVREILDGVGREARALSLNELRRSIAATVACHAAIKVNMALDQEKMSWLLLELSKTECPMSCPHGRPIVLRYDMKEIQKAFKRI
ncbi:MAG TPA: DNA mismatch repair endonuclease MutL [Terriglobia bacterium]|nr:DNA mismatch repair endonuclease MutL [Terriglobia bacterium]